MKSVFDKPKYVAAAYPHRFHGQLFVSSIAGGTPTDQKVAEGWLRTKIGDKDDLIRQAVAEVMVERGVDAEEATQIVDSNKHLNGFKRDSSGLYIEGRQLKACIKEAGNIAINAGTFPTKWGGTNKGWMGWSPEHIFVVEHRLHLGVSEPTDIAQRFVHTWRADSIQYEEYVDDAKIDFTLITDHAFKAEEWAMLWSKAEQNGIGASRKQGYGRFAVTKWEKA